MQKKKLAGIIPAIVVTLTLAGILALSLFLSGADDGRGAILRALALSGLLASFLACISSLFAVELAKKTGLPFLAIHHGWALAAALTVPLHIALALWHLGPELAAYLAPDSFGLFLWAGRLALILFLAGAGAGIFRAALGKGWRLIHALNWAAFLVASLHAQLGGTSFQALPVRILGAALALGLMAAFVGKRYKMQKK